MNQSRMSLTEGLPLDFQFLPADDKQREPDPDLREDARLAGQTFTREERVWSNPRLAFVLHTQQQGGLGA